MRVKELEEENASLRAVIILKDAKIAQFESKVKELTERLNKNSSNSHKPPSSDGYGKKPAFPKSKCGKQGGQDGHKGGTLLMESNPDVTQPLIPLVCDCGHDISNEPLIVGEQRQVHDIPRPKKEVIAFQQYNVQCPCCGKVNKGQFPAGVNSAVQYGTRIRTLSVLLNTDYKIPVKKISSLLGDLYGITPNEGSIMSNNRRCYEILEPVEHRIKEEIRLIHDCYESYFKLTKAKHGLCGAHLLRELASQIDDKKAWAQLMSEMLLELLKQAKIDINQNIKNRVFIEKQYDIIISDGKKEEPPPQKSGKRGKYKRSKGLNLLERLEKHKESVLAHAFDPIIPFTNNLAERDLRPSKIKMKVSNTFRSIEGANHHARLAGFTSTLRKQNINVFSTIMDVFDGKEITFAQ